MKCPRCLQPIHRAAEECPLCGFSVSDADRMFGMPKRIGILSDEAGIIRKHERDRVLLALRHLNQKFPQIFAALHTGASGHIRHLRPFAFWLLNRSTFTDLPESLANQHGILLLLDPAIKSATISFGYMLEPFLDEHDTFECLSRAHAYWLDGHYAEGTLKALAHLEQVLCSKSRKSGTIVKRWQASQRTFARKGETT